MPVSHILWNALGKSATRGGPDGVPPVEDDLASQQKALRDYGKDSRNVDQPLYNLLYSDRGLLENATWKKKNPSNVGVYAQGASDYATWRGNAPSNGGQPRWERTLHTPYGDITATVDADQHPRAVARVAAKRLLGVQDSENIRGNYLDYAKYKGSGYRWEGAGDESGAGTATWHDPGDKLRQLAFDGSGNVIKASVDGKDVPVTPALLGELRGYGIKYGRLKQELLKKKHKAQAAYDAALRSVLAESAGHRALLTRLAEGPVNGGSQQSVDLDDGTGAVPDLVSRNAKARLAAFDAHVRGVVPRSDDDDGFEDYGAAAKHIEANYMGDSQQSQSNRRHLLESLRRALKDSKKAWEDFQKRQEKRQEQRQAQRQSAAAEGAG